jgi:hypothetical protein
MKEETEAVGRDEQVESEIEDSDFGFIITEEGELKAVFMPLNNDYTIPDNVREVFKLFGIKSPESVEAHTIH